MAADEARARAEIEAATKKARTPSSSIATNLLLFVALLAVILVVIREMNEGAEKEVSPFEAPPPSKAMAPKTNAPAAAAGPGFEVEIDVDPAVGAPPRGTLYVIVRLQGVKRGPPVAVKPIKQPSFPLKITMGPGDVMLPNMPFDGPFDVNARLDTDGDAMTKTPGDLVASASGRVTPAEGAKLSLRLDERIE